MNPLAMVTAQLKALSRGEIQKEDIRYKEDDEIGHIVSSTNILINSMQKTINQANSVASGNFTNEIELLGENDKLGFALIGMRNRLKEISNLAAELSIGNYDVKIIAKGSDDELGLSLLNMVEYLSVITRIAESISEGNLDVHYKIKGVDDRLGLAIGRMIGYLKRILKQAKAIAKEDYTHTVKVKSSNDELGLSIITMTDILKLNSQKNRDEMYFADGIAEFNDSLIGMTDITELSKESISIACRYVGASKGAIYTFDKDKNELTLAATFAFDEDDNRSNIFKLGEGVVGQVALEKQAILLKEGSSEIQSSTTTFQQKEAYLFPIIYNGDILGVAEIMSLKEFTKIDKEYFTKISTIFSTALYTARQNAQIKMLLEKSQHAYEELQVQSEEIQETNVEMQEQQQQLTLQSNELKDKNTYLAKAKQEIDQKAKDLEKASKYKSEFLANMSHELRTPLNSIILLSKLLAVNSEKMLDEDSVKKISVINRAGNDLLLLINDILDLTKIESGKTELSISEVYSRDILDEMRGLFNSLSQERGVEFILHDNFNDKFMTDQTKLAQVLKNLLSNAFKFTKKGSVSLDVSSTESELSIRVKDTGIGIQSDKLSTIFEAFKQVDGSISREFGGTGLGLSINIQEPLLIKEENHSKSLVKVQDNPVDIISIVPDDDSSFTTDVLANKNILIVDDDSRNIFTLTAVLENLKADVYSAFNGKEAIEVLESQKIDIVLMDIMMPVMDGLKAIKSIKSNPRFKDIPIIAITAKTMPQDKQDCLDAGANDYLAKPLQHSALVSMLKAWVK
jgi:signal transduction histidine kinase/HAMP domain-containing protein